MNKKMDTQIYCKVSFKNVTNCPPLAHFWGTIGEDAMSTRLALLPVGSLYSLLVLIVLIATLWHSVDEVRFGQCLCMSCDVPANSMMRRSLPAYILQAQAIPNNQESNSLSRLRLSEPER